VHGRLCDRLEKNHGATMDPGMELLRDGPRSVACHDFEKNRNRPCILEFFRFTNESWIVGWKE